MTVWLRVSQTLVDLLPTLSGWGAVTVLDGPPLTGDAPLTYCTVGFAANEDSAGSYETQPVDATGLVTEAGFVRCELVARTGDSEVPVLLARTIDLLDALAERLRTDQRIGEALPYVATSRLLVDVLPILSQEGSAVRCPFSVAYTART